VDDEERLREAYKSANAINRLEGYEATDADLARQERVIRGELTFDEAVQEIIGHMRSRS
jgi:hypothetical protein